MAEQAEDQLKPPKPPHPLPKRLRKRFKHVVKRRLRPALNRMLVRYSEVGDPVVFDKELFPWTKELEAHFEDIRRDALRLGELHDALPTFRKVSPYQKRISKGPRWKTLWLYGFGHESEIAKQLCPATAKALEHVPELQSAVFSLLAPGAHIRPHRGLYKGLVNYHLGVVIPKQPERCHMRLGDETIVWQPGQSYVFDDTNLHEVWNESDEERIVLFLQFHRPFRSPGRQLSRLFLWTLRFTPYVRTPMRNVREFDRRLQQTALERGLLRPHNEIQGG